MFHKDKLNENLQVLSEEERKNPGLVKQRQNFKESHVSIYYGSAKKELEDVCINCKKKNKCIDYFNIKEQEMQLRRAADISEITAGFSQKEIDKLKHNVFIAINCIYKEE